MSNQDIHEIVLFPLPVVPYANSDSNFTDTSTLINSFKVWVNGKAIKPSAHVRAFWLKTNDDEEFIKVADITEALKHCGFSQKELMNPWTNQYNEEKLVQKIARCQEPLIRRLNPTGDVEKVFWGTQIVYSWPQTFKAHAITEVKHQYVPLLGSGTYFNVSKNKDNPFYKQYCVDDAFRAEVQRKYQNYYLFHTALSYILTTGANWAKPIGKFTLTIERNPNELVSLCWDKSLRKVGENRFRAVKHHFLPQRDLDIVFVQPIIHKD